MSAGVSASADAHVDTPLKTALTQDVINYGDDGRLCSVSSCHSQLHSLCAGSNSNGTKDWQYWFIFYRNSPTKWSTMLTHKGLTVAECAKSTTFGNQPPCKSHLIGLYQSGCSLSDGLSSDQLSQSGVTCQESLGGIKGFTDSYNKIIKHLISKCCIQISMSIFRFVTTM